MKPSWASASVPRRYAFLPGHSGFCPTTVYTRWTQRCPPPDNSECTVRGLGYTNRKQPKTALVGRVNCPDLMPSATLHSGPPPFSGRMSSNTSSVQIPKDPLCAWDLSPGTGIKKNSRLQFALRVQRCTFLVRQNCTYSRHLWPQTVQWNETDEHYPDLDVAQPRDARRPT